MILEKIIGFQNYKFGRTIKQVLEIDELVATSANDDGQWFNTRRKTTILGENYTQSLLFGPDGKLKQVNVFREFEGGDIACSGAFEEAFGAIRATYGNADQPPDRTVHGGISAITTARFTHSNGSSVRLSSVFISGCLINVAYTAGTDGSGF
mgnify:FL=1